MSNGRPTVNGLCERIAGLEKLMDREFKGVAGDISAIKADMKALRDNEMVHLKADIEGLKKFQWKLIGGLGVLWAAIQAALKYLPPLLK